MVPTISVKSFILPTGLLVQSTSLTTTLDAPLGLDGMYYCKLMSPVRAIEYLLVDSLRRTEP